MASRLENALKVGVIFMTAIMILMLLIWDKTSVLDSRNTQAQGVARCKSLGGEYASGKCFVNGEEK